MDFEHKPVLLHEAVRSLNIKSNGIYVDCTLGGGGHTSRILHLLKSGHVYAFDQDAMAINYNKQHLSRFIDGGQITLIHDNFKNLKKDLNNRSVNQVNGVLYDLGVSSPQFDDADRGFSYRLNARLDMRMDQRNPLDAWQIINKWPYSKLVKIISRYGGEKFAKSISRRIEYHRAENSINTTGQLVDIIKEGIPAAARRHGGNPAKRTFQAIRIAVNHELSVLETSLEQALKIIKIRGRISVITFEPLEDRLVKNIFKEMTTIQDVPRGLPVIPKSMLPHFKMVYRKPIRPTRKEELANHRSHSARLRVIERIKK